MVRYPSRRAKYGRQAKQEECVQFTRPGKVALIAGALVALSPSAAPAAQGDRDTTTTTRTSSTVERENEFPWGLLGLLGLLGLAGLRRRERDIHVDARRHTDTERRP